MKIIDVQRAGRKLGFGILVVVSCLIAIRFIFGEFSISYIFDPFGSMSFLKEGYLGTKLLLLPPYMVEFSYKRLGFTLVLLILWIFLLLVFEEKGRLFFRLRRITYFYLIYWFILYHIGVFGRA